MRLSDIIKNRTNAHIITLVGTDSAKIKKQTMDSLANIPQDEHLIIIATGKYVGEGFDYPRLDTLFLASPIAWKGTLAQYAGRLHREYPGKQDVIIYDYVDFHIPVLERMYHKRLSGYAQIGYKTLAAHNQPDKINLIYNADSFVPVMKNDFVGARKEILIVSPFLRQKQITTILDWLKEPDKTKYEIHKAIQTALKSAKNRNQFRDLLMKEKIQVKFKYKGQSDEVQGISFAKGDYSFKGSEIDRNFSYSKLDAVLSEDRQSQQIQVQQSQESATSNSADLVSGLGGIFDIQLAGSDYDPDQAEYLQQLKLKKKKKRKGLKM